MVKLDIQLLNGFLYDQEGGIIDLEDWLSDGIYPRDGQSIDDFINEILASDGGNGCYFNDGENNYQAIRAKLVSIWAWSIHDGNIPPAIVCEFLHDMITC